MLGLFDEFQWRAETKWRHERLLKETEERRLSKMESLNNEKREGLFALFRLQKPIFNLRMNWKL